MTKALSTYEKKMKDLKFKKAYKESYNELLISELIISLMENDNKSIRNLAKEANLSPSVIQDLRAGKQQDIKVSNLIRIGRVFGYELVLEKGNKRLPLCEAAKKSKCHVASKAA